MIKIEFICHGNICRSPLAEYILKAFTKKLGIVDNFEICSAATSQEEIGNSVYPPVKKLLESKGIDCSAKRARRVSLEDIKNYDYIIAMEEYNLQNLYNLFPKTDKSKVYLLLDFTETPGDIDDPWYTRDFDKAFNQIVDGCRGLLLSLHNDSLITLSDKSLTLLNESLF